MAVQTETASGLALAPLEGEARWFAGSLVVVKLRAEETGGRLGAAELVQPREVPVPPHVHSREDETMVVLEGEVAVRIGDREVLAQPGAVLFTPPGVVHAFATTSPEPARILLAWTPGGFESIFLKLGEKADALAPPPVASEPPPPEVLEAFGRVLRDDFGTEVLAPPQ